MSVDVVVTSETDGSTSIRNTYFVYEDGSWKHRFGSDEYDLFANAQTGSASASSSASVSSSATASSSSSASPKPSPNPAPNRNRNYNAPNRNVPGNGSLMSPEDCISEGGHPVSPSTDGDGDGDGCAGE